jgi:protein-L-isoaspartate(D-aspartate) O-methyltransferase
MPNSWKTFLCYASFSNQAINSILFMKRADVYVAAANTGPATSPSPEVKLTDTKAPDYAWAREKMVQEQLVARGIQSRRVIDAMRRIPRHLFVDPGLVNRAYDDAALPIGEKQTLSQPYMAARMTEALDLKGDEKVLEIGTGSGYQSALLAELCFNVFSVEKIRALARKARALLDRLEYHNIAIHVGDGTIGWSEHAPYDAIIVAAGAPDVPRPLVEQLSVGGKLIIPIGAEESQVLTLYRRERSGFNDEELGECRFVKLWGKFGWQD